MTTTEEELVQAEARVRGRQQTTPRAIAARYDRRVGRIAVVLNSGLEIAFPPDAAQGLETARPEDLDPIGISPFGFGLQVPKLDADLYLSALLEGLFGSKAWAGRQRNAQRGASDGRRKRPQWFWPRRVGS